MPRGEDISAAFASMREVLVFFSVEEWAISASLEGSGDSAEPTSSEAYIQISSSCVSS